MTANPLAKEGLNSSACLSYISISNIIFDSIVKIDRIINHLTGWLDAANLFFRGQIKLFERLVLMIICNSILDDVINKIWV